METVKYMKRQEIFDTIVKQLRSQGWKQSLVVAGEDLGGCAYRGADGMKCAAGALIKDEHYSAKLESHNWTFTNVQQALMKSGVSPLDMGFVGICQSYHDTSWRSSEQMESSFRQVARDFNLVFPEE